MRKYFTYINRFSQKQFSNDSESVKLFNKIISLFILLLVLITSNIADCGTFDSTNTARRNLEALIRTFSLEEIDEFNRLLQEENIPNNLEKETNTNNSLLHSLLLFATINLTIITIARYGSTIFEHLCSLVTESTDTILDAARQAAMHRVNRLLENPENLPRVQNAIQRIIQMRQPHIPPIA